jgi:lipoate-protein ligase A
MTRSHWRFVVTPPAAGAENMALDEALMARARATGDWTLRVYSWSAPTISFGRNQTAHGRYDRRRIDEHGLAVVRRPTGGRAILHHREVTYSVTGPVSDAGELRESYFRINALLLHALRAMGVDATAAAPAGRTPIPDLAPCFDRPSAGELTVRGRKLAGSAQWRSDGALLQHGSILVADDQSLLTELAAVAQAPIPTPATLVDALGRAPSVDDLATALIDAVREHEDPSATELELEPNVRAQALALVVRYNDDAWTWRR